MSALAASQSAAEVRGQVGALRLQLAAATTVQAVRPPNPAWGFIARITGWRMLEATTVWALALMLMLEAFSATIPSAMLRTFPRRPASLPDHSSEEPVTTPADAAQALPLSTANNPPSPPKERSVAQGKTENKVSRSPPSSPGTGTKGDLASP